MGKVCFVDVDNTLTGSEGRIPASAREAIRAARALGHRVYLCTGRSRAEIYSEIWEIGLDGLIGANGGYVEDHEKEIFHQTLSAEDERACVDWLHSRGLEFYLEANDGLFASEHFEERGDAVMREYIRRKDKPVNERFGVREAFPEMIFGADLYRDEVNKISFILESYQDYLDAVEAFPGLKVGTWGGYENTALFGDLALPKIDKGLSVNTLLNYIGAKPEDTIAFGDAIVDIPMFQVCAYSVAMGNADDETKAAADYVTGDVDEDGLAQAFDHLGLTK